MRKILSIALLLLVIFVSFLPSHALAIADPNTPPQISAVYVYEFDDGSIGVLIDYYLDYSSPYPDETATEAYLAVFVDTDGTTQLKSVAPYTYVNSGYERGLVWIAFTADEVTAYGIDSADVADYRIWLAGNPTLSWTGDPPKTIGTIDQWNTTGDMNVLLALRVLYYADALELAWSVDMVEATSVGNRLTSTGEGYFENVISNCRNLAPLAFSDTTARPDYVDITYDTAFGATAISGTATVTGSPVTLAEGSNSITASTTGTIILDLAQWTYGTLTDDTGTATGSPVTLYPGTNTITVTVAGIFTVEVEVADTSTELGDTVTGTGLDLTDAATAFGMTRWMFSGIIWLLITVAICGAAFASSRKQMAMYGAQTGGAKVTMILATLCFIGGALLGLLHPLVVSLLFIGYGTVIGYILFFRSETLHKGFMFMIWMFVIVSIAGNWAASGQSSIIATRLEENITSTETASIEVASTVGFPDAGIITIGDEQLTYPRKDDTHFLGGTFNPIARGSGGTDAAAHSDGDTVRSKESYILNASIDYKIAQLIDSAGALGYIAAPVRLFDLIYTFFKLPLEFLGTDMAVLSYIWMVVAVGMIVGFIVALAGGRRV